MDPKTGQFLDTLTPQAKQMVKAIGSCNIKVSDVLYLEDRAVFTAIREGLDKANEHATSQAHKVSISVLVPYLAELPLLGQAQIIYIPIYILYIYCIIHSVVFVSDVMVHIAMHSCSRDKTSRTFKRWRKGGMTSEAETDY